jgi:hypothetical protein
MSSFINSDGLFGPIGDILGHNMYAYCVNNPVMRIDPNGDFWWLIVVAAVLLVSLVSCSPTQATTTNSSEYGAAPVYSPVAGGENSPNCYSYAIGLNRAINPGMLSGTTLTMSDFSDVEMVAQAVINDFLAMGRSVRRLTGPDDAILANEYRIALRVGTTPFYNNRFDYHFMVQTSTGRWAEKHGTAGNSIIWDYGNNPGNIPWSLGTILNYYDSEIVYFAIGK